MENATKALIIAGSILIAILLIALGVRVITTSAEPTDQVKTNLKANEIAMFNNKFTPYVGKLKTLVEVKSLADAVIASNAVSTNPDITFYVKVSSITCETTNASIISNTVGNLPERNYKIKAEYSSEGIINKISITK